LLPKFNKMKTAPNFTGALTRYQNIDLKDNSFNEELSAVGGIDSNNDNNDNNNNMQLGVN
jgi:hypothetical protein